MKSTKSKLLTAVAVVAIICAGVVFFPKINISDSAAKTTKVATITKKVKEKKKTPKKVTDKNQKYLPYEDPQDLSKPGSWKVKSERKAHPELKAVKNLWIRVSLKGNRTYVMSGKKPVYTMLSTGGVYKDGKSATPTGTFYVEAERGAEFFNQGLNEGARYYVSWKDHGIYLFHSVPTKADKKINVQEADKLGRTQGSHGCVRLSLPDAKWFCYNLPMGTKVVIKDE
ncbi:D-alanyl-D-alanine carboxypeptidase (penicillin-binding protein 5/6) [Lactobacillus colini]|uniref:D-alanyl-D-alanine carboxypeptidase (Penicillin-binding protein 5/6) n=1 Tax=Lactobacillus colini TaxID=1819254 RepID=A0ABS4MF04_9LACO|nr:L,D-transpeptidase [Lactobacillus colini]MBP2058270.1 D-alanyl-D-alanine carboxypeptidase (penicillin-binding protein 5/6) [Lactobacillus colini]